MGWIRPRTRISCESPARRGSAAISTMLGTTLDGSARAEPAAGGVDRAKPAHPRPFDRADPRLDGRQRARRTLRGGEDLALDSRRPAGRGRAGHRGDHAAPFGRESAADVEDLHRGALY